LRDPIVCPSCGAQYVPDVPLIDAEAGTRTARPGWRGRRFKLPPPAPDAVPEVAATEDANEEALIPAPTDDVVLEEEPDEGDISGLIDHHESDDPKER